jgi:Pilus formation protein N terminal region
VRTVLENAMAALLKHRRNSVGFWLLAVPAACIVQAMPAQAQTLPVNLDQAEIMQLPDRVATIVIGNPLIADATLQSGGILVVTGKGYGSTNLMALDRAGRVLLSRTVQVLPAGTEDVVTVYKGVERESYSCAPYCQRRITLGDSPAYFNANLTQSGQRSGQAQATPAR